jgi:protein O-mannosyl-transferase
MKPAKTERLSPQDVSAPTAIDPRHIRLALAIIAIMAVTLATHWPALSTKAIWLDDADYITGNDVISRPSLTSIGRALSEVTHPSIRGYYQPLPMISLMLDVDSGGSLTHPAPFRVTSLGLHVANTALLVVLLYLLLKRPLPAALAGLLFGLHPITVEPVVWLAERKALLAAFFSLAALIAYVVYTRRHQRSAATEIPDPQTPPSRAWWVYLAALALYALALLSKPTATPLPLLMLLLDCWPLRRLSWAAIREKVPFLAVGVASGVITMISQGATAVLEMPAGNSAAAVPLEMACRFTIHLTNFFWPLWIAPYYPAPQPASLANPVVLASILVVVGLIVGVVVALRWTRAPLIGLLLFTVALAPTIGLFRYTPMFTLTNYGYLPALGWLLLIAAGLARLLPAAGVGLPRSWRTLVAVALVLAVAVGEAVAMRRYIHRWDDTLSLARCAVQMAPTAAMPHRALGDALDGVGRRDEAIAEYEQALAINPAGYQARVNLGKVLIETGRPKQAAEQLTEALRIRPGLPDTLLNLGVALAQQGQLDDAAARFTEAAKANPRDARALYNLGHLRELEGRRDEARERYAAAVKLAPRYYEAHVALANLLSSGGDMKGAAREYETAASLNPRDPEVRNNLGVVLSQLGRDQEAIHHLQAALELQPGFTAARDNLDKVKSKAAQGK